MINYKVSDHFDYDDFACACCERLKLTDRFYKHIELLEKVRAEYGKPMLINSGYRCSVHNQAVGGAVKSQHLIFATDIRPEMGRDDDEYLQNVLRIEDISMNYFKGIGLYNTFVHVDLRTGKPAFWDKRTI